MPQQKRRYRPILLVIALGGAYGFVGVSYLIPRGVIDNIDFWYHISVGLQLSFTNIDTLVNGLYPIGYPFLLAGAIHLGLDVLRFGQVLSLVGGGIALLSTYICAWQLLDCLELSTQKRLNGPIALISGLVLVTNENFMNYATREGNDMLSTGLQLLALTLLFSLIRSKHKKIAPQMLLFSGIALGLAYLARYTALVLLPIIILFSLIHYARSPKRLLANLLWFVLPFLVVASAQWIPSWVSTGNPFFNTQAKNVWFGIYGQHDWVSNWHKVPDEIALLEVIALDPGQFFRHWWSQIQRAVTSVVLWPTSIHWLSFFAVIVFILDTRITPAYRLLLSLSFMATISFTALAWLDERFMLVPLSLQALYLTYISFRFSTLLTEKFLANKPLINNMYIKEILCCLPLALIIAMQGQSWRTWWQSTPMAEPITVNRLLRSAGMKAPERVATNHPYLHAAHLPARTRYSQIYQQIPEPRHSKELLNHLYERETRYLILDDDGFGNYSAIREDLIQEKERLIPLSIEDDRVVFCLIPCQTDSTHKTSYQFGPLLLSNYSINQTQNRVGLYLYWQADLPMKKSYKVSIRVITPDGQTNYQIDGIPQLWSYPTTEWSTTDLVADFYTWETAEACYGCAIYVLVYDSETLEPLHATDTNNVNLGPLVRLAEL
ncbi:MAG: glycosyltransferase family 39 protein [Chloroflexota bacterium]